MADKPMTVADVREMLKGKKPAQAPATTDETTETPLPVFTTNPPAANLDKFGRPVVKPAETVKPAKG